MWVIVGSEAWKLDAKDWMQKWAKPYFIWLIMVTYVDNIILFNKYKYTFFITLIELNRDNIFSSLIVIYLSISKVINYMRDIFGSKAWNSDVK